MKTLNVPEREFLAFHEAGHAVMASYLRRPIRRASIRQQHGLSGYVDYENASAALAELRDEHRAIVEVDALILLAGRAAECERTLGSPMSHASLDRQNARALLASLEDCEEVVSNWMRYLLVRAQSILQQEWPVVHAVAHALLKEEELDGIDIARVIVAARQRIARGQHSFLRILISDDALASMHDLPHSECGLTPPQLPSGDVLPFPADRAAASAVPAQNDRLHRRALADVMRLSDRAHKCLARGGIVTFGDLVKRTVCDLASIQGLGPSTLDEIMAEVNRLGIELRVAPLGELIPMPRR